MPCFSFDCLSEKRASRGILVTANSAWHSKVHWKQNGISGCSRTTVALNSSKLLLLTSAVYIEEKSLTVLTVLHFEVQYSWFKLLKRYFLEIDTTLTGWQIRKSSTNKFKIFSLFHVKLSMRMRFAVARAENPQNYSQKGYNVSSKRRTYFNFSGKTFFFPNCFHSS